MTSGGKDKIQGDGLYLILTEDAQKPRSLLHFDAFKQKNIDPLRIKRMVKSPDMVPMIEVFFSEGVDARLESFTVSAVLRSSNGMSPEIIQI